MNLDKITTFQEKREQESTSNANMTQITDTQNVLRNKFEKACMNRFNHEQEVNQALKPLTSIPSPSSLTSISISDLDSRENVFSLRKLSTTSNKFQSIGKNDLCERLRVLLNSQIADNVNHTQEINSIIIKLRELGILI